MDQYPIRIRGEIIYDDLVKHCLKGKLDRTYSPGQGSGYELSKVVKIHRYNHHRVTPKSNVLTNSNYVNSWKSIQIICELTEKTLQKRVRG